MRNKFIFLCFMLHFSTYIHAQNVGINNNGASPISSAMLDVSASNKGMLIPRVALSSTTDVVTIPNPATSLLVYNTNTNIVNGAGAGYYYWNGNAWGKLLNVGNNTSSSPKVNDRLKWNGNEWISVKNDTIIGRAGIINGIPSTPTGNPPWLFLGFDAPVEVTVDGDQIIFASAVASLSHASNNNVTISANMCYQSTAPNSPILPFFPSSFPDVSILPQPTKTLVPAVGRVKLPAGTYKIGMGVRNKSTTVSLPGNDYINLVVEVRN